MSPKETIYILGAGAVGFPLAAYLAEAGRAVVAVRTSRQDVAKGTITVTVHNGTNQISPRVETISLAGLDQLDGIEEILKDNLNMSYAVEGPCPKSNHGFHGLHRKRYKNS